MYYHIHAKRHSQALTAGFMSGGALSSPPPPGYLISKKHRLLRVNRNRNRNIVLGNLQVYFKSSRFTVTTAKLFVILEG